MSRVACPHCSEPIENDPSLAGEAAICPHCDGEFQFPDPEPAPLKRAKPVAEPTAPRRSSATKAPSSTASKKEPKTSSTAKSKTSGKQKSAGKEPPATLDWKKLAPRIGMIAGAVVVLATSIFFLFGRKRDFAPEKKVVASYISGRMSDAKLTSWG
jgi:hypothetical protein